MFEPRGSDGHAACTSPPRVDRGASRRTAGNRNRFAVCTATTLLLACSNSVKVTASDVGAASVKLSAAGLPLSTGGFNGLDDSVFFGMSWVPELPADLSKYISTPMTVRGHDQAEYSCYLPKADADDQGVDGSKDDKKPKPKTLLAKLKDKCLRRLDVYWAYELCVDQHVRQYHEDVAVTTKGEKEKDVTEHFLGRSRKILTERGEEADTLDSSNSAGPPASPTFQYEGKETTYYTETYVGGDICDLTGNPRTTEVRYICDKGALHAMGSMQETTTCNYQVVVHTSLLCSHPDFALESAVAHEIACVPKGHADAKPKALLELEAVRAAELQDIRAREQEEAAVQQLQKEKRAAKQAATAGGSSSTFKPSSSSSSSSSSGGGGSGSKSISLAEVAQKKGQLQKQFIQMLKGKHCFNGGTGWWQVEYCYGDYVAQVHRNDDGTKDVVKLGAWDGPYQKKMHKAASKTASIKGSKASSATQYMKNGDFCADSKANRKIKVKLVCASAATGAKDGTVTLDLVETKTCEYTLKVLSPMVCPLLINVRSTDGTIDLAQPPELSDVEKEALAEKEAQHGAALKAQQEAARMQMRKQAQLREDERERKSNQKAKAKGGDASTKGLQGSVTDSQKTVHTKPNLVAAKRTLHKFLKGKHCFMGGQGWWQFEFCYKKHVRQIHRNDDGTKVVVKLGEWSAEYHEKKRSRTTSSTAKFATAHFDLGDFCDASNSPRKTEVKMICSTKLTGSQVSLSLTEPKTCEYVLKVESLMFCELLGNLGPDGLFDVTEL